MEVKKQMNYKAILFVLFIVATLYFMRYFNLTWVETSENGAKVTINFLFPMNQEAFKEHLAISSSIEACNEFNYSLEWFNAHVVEIQLQENNSIKGQKVNLLISNAPTQFKGLSKSSTINVQFKTNVEIISPTKELLISSTQPFVIQFNTPMAFEQIHKYIQCNAAFYIKPYETTLESGEKWIDPTKIQLVPKNALENGKRYVLLFKGGAPSQGGSNLKNDYAVVVQVDSKPIIVKTYPQSGDKWIGLYPCLTLESKEPIVEAIAVINNQQIKGTLADPYHAYFLMDKLLEPETLYQVHFQTQVASGEVSEVMQVEFTTTTIQNNRFWVEVYGGTKQIIKCYQGNKCIKTIPYQISSKENFPRYGTYYLQSKEEVYENNQLHIGSNYWMKLTENFGIHGQQRNAYWKILDAPLQAENIMVTDEEAAWLYEKMLDQTMIILRE